MPAGPGLRTLTTGPHPVEAATPTGEAGGKTEAIEGTGAATAVTWPPGEALDRGGGERSILERRFYCINLATLYAFPSVPCIKHIKTSIKIL